MFVNRFSLWVVTESNVWFLTTFALRLFFAVSFTEIFFQIWSSFFEKPIGDNYKQRLTLYGFQAKHFFKVQITQE